MRHGKLSAQVDLGGEVVEDGRELRNGVSAFDKDNEISEDKKLCGDSSKRSRK